MQYKRIRHSEIYVEIEDGTNLERLIEKEALGEYMLCLPVKMPKIINKCLMGGLIHVIRDYS